MHTYVREVKEIHPLTIHDLSKLLGLPPLKPGTQATLSLDGARSQVTLIITSREEVNVE